MSVKTYSLHLNVANERSAHPDQVDIPDVYVDEITAENICLLLNQGDYLRDGVTIHYVSAD